MEEDDHLPGPARHRFMPPVVLLMIPLGRGEHGEEGQRPGVPGPGDRDQQQQGDPTQRAPLDEMAVAGAHRGALDAGRRDRGAAPPLQRDSDAHHQRPRRRNGADQQAEQDAAGGEAGPHRAVEHPVIGRERGAGPC